jgi:hypothetical protein
MRELSPLCFNYHIPQPNRPTRTVPRRSKMPTAADIAAAKNALKEKVWRELEELDRAEEEQKRKEEAEAEAARKAAEAAEEEKRKQAEIAAFAQREREILGERKKKAKAKKRAEVEKKAEAKKKAEEKKWRREDSVEVTVGAILVEDEVTWMVKDGKVCEGCEEKGKKCFWRDSARAKSCHNCHALKKTCMVGVEESEAGPSKKRRVTKGKGKEKERSESESDAVAEAIRELKEEMREAKEETRGVRETIAGLRMEFHALGEVGRAIVKVLQSIHGDVGFVAEQMDPLNAVGEEVGGGVGEGVGQAERPVGVEESENNEGMEGTLE